MIAYVTSVNEPTTDVCVWSLERNGFEVILLKSDSTLHDKLSTIYKTATEDFLRVDADIIVNRNMTPRLLTELSDNKNIWWWQFVVYDWFKQDVSNSLAFIKKEALEALRNNIDRFNKDIRPETRSSRIDELCTPRRLETYTEKIMGIHGYGTKNLEPVKDLKKARKQMDIHDFELMERLNSL
jgi:hypothetical protein